MFKVSFSLVHTRLQMLVHSEQLLRLASEEVRSRSSAMWFESRLSV